jgi:hypothetical protein
MKNRVTKSSCAPPEEDSPVLPVFETLSDLVDFFDTHDIGDYAAKMPEVHFEVMPGKEAGQAGNG